MDNLTKKQRRINMQRIRSVGTKPEKIIAQQLRKKGIYFSQHLKSLPGKPDFVLRKYGVVVFVDSDFWHCNPKHFIMPKTNKIYWKTKISNNIKRDKIVNKLLKGNGWKVIRIWEYDINNSLNRTLLKIYRAINNYK
ncbi:very short patch repair endonuclease [candidate division TA06 bacterium]|nr:very short patch repair endonuclease [candidate division TA06 bacterium]